MRTRPNTQEPVRPVTPAINRSLEPRPSPRLEPAPSELAPPSGSPRQGLALSPRLECSSVRSQFTAASTSQAQAILLSLSPEKLGLQVRTQCSLLLPCEDTPRRPSPDTKCWHFDLGLPKLQNQTVQWHDLSSLQPLPSGIQCVVADSSTGFFWELIRTTESQSTS
ncbi:uncharacterized protein LOC144581759 [Callithrix jacchus]